MKTLKMGILFTNQCLGGLACGAPTTLINVCLNLFIYLDYLEFVVILCKKAIKYMFPPPPKIVSFDKNDILTILRIYRIHSRINKCTGKWIINWNHYKSMQAIKFLNEKIIRIYLFCPFSSWNTRQRHFKWSIVTEPSPPS